MKKISAFMDGEASRFETRQIMSRLKMNEEDRQVWETFHLIGDVMRGDAAPGDGFTSRMRTCIEQEPTVLAPRISMMLRKPAQYALPAVASLAGVAIVLTLVFTDNPLNPTNSQPQIAAAPMAIAKTETAQAPRAVSVPQPVPAANQGRVNEYLMAHQEYSTSTALQGLAPYIRTVSAAQDANAR